MDPVSVTSTITGAIAGFDTQLLAVGAAGIGVAAAPFLLRRGWALIKSFVK